MYIGVQSNVIQPAGGRNATTHGLKGYTFVLGHYLNKYDAAVELNCAYHSDAPRTLTATSNWVSCGLNGLWYPWSGRQAFKPFMLIGAGHLYEYRGDGSEPSSNYLTAGIGLTSRPWEAPVVLRLDFQLQRAFSGGYTDRILNFGVTFPFHGD